MDAAMTGSAMSQYIFDKIVDIQRWTLREGDRLIIRIDRDVTTAQARELMTQVKNALHLPDDFPLAMSARNIDFYVLSEPEPGNAHD